MKLFFKTAVVSLNLLLVGNLCCLDCSGASANINPSETIKILPETKFYINKNGGISHNTYILENKTQKLFFKETKEKLSMYGTAERAIKEYFGDTWLEAQNSMLEDLKNQENLENFMYMKTYDNGQAAKWLKSKDKSDTSCIGFPTKLPSDFVNNKLPKFLSYAFSEFVQYRANKNRSEGELQLNQLIGSLASVKLAELLDLSDLLVKTKYVKLSLPDTNTKLGILMDCAQGLPFQNLKEIENKIIDPQLQLDFSKLMILDALCAQRDRGVGNFFTKLDNNKIIGIHAYDNDLSFDAYTNLRTDDYLLPAIINSDNTITLPHMDKKLAEKILSLNYKDIENCLKDLLIESQIDATINRLHQIQSSIKHTMKLKNDFLLKSNSDWTEKTMQEETNTHNKTYFNSFLKNLGSYKLDKSC